DVRDVADRLARFGLVQPIDVARAAPTMQDIDWRRIAEPQVDQYDTEVVLDFAAARSGLGPQHAVRDGSHEPRFLDGRVGLGHCYRPAHAGTVNPRCIDAPLDHPHLARAAAYLANWPTAQEQLARLMTCLHPLIDPQLPCDESAFLVGSTSH